MQSPLGAEAPDGVPGDMVRVSDGTSTVYLSPADYDSATEPELRYLLAKGSR